MQPPSLPTCPRCGEPRILGPECPRCGVLYARARAREVPVPAAPPAETPAFLAGGPERALVWMGDVEEARDELRLRIWTLPAALVVMGVLTGMPFVRRLLRTFLTMWLHELGHAVTAWLCGLPAAPGPWRTAIWEERSSPLFALVAFALMGALFRGVLLRSRPWLIAGAVGLLLQFVGSVCLPYSTLPVLITFGGDGGCLVFGTLLMLTPYAAPHSMLRRDWLHWGLLTIGAASFTDTFRDWWAARSDFAAMTFGSQEGTLSDTSKLVDRYGWSEQLLIQRYLTLAFTCLAVLALVYAVGLWRARATLKALERLLEEPSRALR